MLFYPAHLDINASGRFCRCVILIMFRPGWYVTIFVVAAGLVAGEIRDKGWWKNTVFYQIYPRSFKDSNGDGVGDLQGITQYMQHFVDSGVGAIWLSPICVSPMVDFGYDISDFRDVDPTFGTLADFDALVKRAKELGLKVILDLVPNHTSDKHYWFQQSVERIGKYTNYYVWKDGPSDKPPNNWLSLFNGRAWTYHPDRKQWYLHQFERRQPDLNYLNEEVQNELRDIILFWLRKGVDGFRVDAVPYLVETENFPDEPVDLQGDKNESDYTHLQHIYTKDHPKTYEIIKSWRKILDDYADEHNEAEKLMMTEAYTSLENTTRFYTAGSHIPFNFKFITEVNAKSKAADIKKAIDDWLKAMPNGSTPNWVMGNHDNKRLATRFPGRADQMVMLGMVLPGATVTYYGEEIGMEDKSDISYDETKDPQGRNAGKDKYQEVSRDPCRTPFQWNSTEPSAGFSTTSTTWLPVHQNYKTLNLMGQKLSNNSHYKLYQALTSMRKLSRVLKEGTLQTIVPADNNDVFAVVRNLQNQYLMLVINLSNSTVNNVNLAKVMPGKVTVELADSPVSGKKGDPVDVSKISLQPRAALLMSSTSSPKSDNGSGMVRNAFSGTVFMVLLTMFFR